MKIYNSFYSYIITRFPLIKSFYDFAFRLFFLNKISKIKLKFCFCPICNKKSLILLENKNLRETGICLFCSANSRYKAMAELLKKIIFIKNHFKEFNIKKLEHLIYNFDLSRFSLNNIIENININNLNIYEPSSLGAIFKILKNIPNFVYSEFFQYPNLKPGQMVENIRFENLEFLSFKDNSFDLIITQDVLEHVRDPKSAFKEIYRVLKPNGIHVFTVPLEKRQKSVMRINKKNEILIKPIKYHSDNLSLKGPIVYNDWGYDIIDYLSDLNFSSFIYSINNPELGILGKIEILISLKR